MAYVFYESGLSVNVMYGLEDGKKRALLFTGFVTDGLALKAVAIVHAPRALPAIDRALKRAREK